MSIVSVRPLKLSAALIGLTVGLGACALTTDDDSATNREALRETRSGIGGRWIPPKATGRNGMGSAQEVGGEKCSGGLKEGAKALGAQLKAQFKFSEVQGYNCRKIGGSTKMSIHSVGRAIDLMTTNVTIGDSVANHLVKNAASLGIQRIIWNRTIWQVGGSGATSKAYSGQSPHTDHVHAELTKAAATNGPGEATSVDEGEEETTTPSKGTSGTGKTPTPREPSTDDTGFEPECAKATDCDPSGTIKCDQGFCVDPKGQDEKFDDMDDEFECQTAKDCDPSGAMACHQGFCDLVCDDRAFNLGICE
jgi:hypothetical protein